MKHGRWLPWLEANFEASHKHATRYMKIASNMTRVSTLPEAEKPESIRQALKLISAPDKGAAEHITSRKSVECGINLDAVSGASMCGWDIQLAHCKRRGYPSRWFGKG